ncbi:sigma-70 family RNA polymerase sigma factor [Microbacterium gorillae]|uniref:sigma-70 family RNA polymerase sigma factor n=1 Tax=Microbacterium gorillae TaxID=1231063 RepID=UPI00058E6A9B|nr:sigma-70 family RNA polymerase sigma factor [Microbacterium gorillae]
MTSAPASAATDAWSLARGRLLGIAYRMLGDWGEAEDVVSEVAITALAAEREHTPVRSWSAWLTTVCVRRSVDRVRTLAAAREVYPGPWLPEPVDTARLPDEVAATRELLSLTLLHVAEQLTPEARAALVLHRAFAMTAPEIGEILQRSPASVRQLISRAERRLDITPDQSVADRANREALQRLADAVESGDVAAVVELLEDDATLFSDGGGIVSAARNPIFGADRIARFLLGVMAKAIAAGATIEMSAVMVNGELGMDARRLGDGSGRRDVMVIRLDPSGRVRTLLQVCNPAKLTRI